jgi:hypothetical protein
LYLSFALFQAKQIIKTTVTAGHTVVPKINIPAKKDATCKRDDISQNEISGYSSFILANQPITAGIRKNKISPNKPPTITLSILKNSIKKSLNIFLFISQILYFHSSSGGVGRDFSHSSFVAYEWGINLLQDL